jgi:hypothetical protein
VAKVPPNEELVFFDLRLGEVSSLIWARVWARRPTHANLMKA